MSIKHNILKQFHKPTGHLGQLVGMIMSIKNRKRLHWTIEKVNNNPSDYILEIGYGPGATFERIANTITTGFIAGIDHSEIMCNQASKRNRKIINNKKAELKFGTVWDLDFPEKYFDIIYGSNVHFFWEDPVNEFQKLYSLLKPGGRLVMVFQPRWAKSEDHVKQIAEKTKKQFEEVGCQEVEIDFKPMKPVTCIYVGGKNL